MKFPFEHLELYSKVTTIDGKKVNLEEKLDEIKKKPTLLFISRYPIYTISFLQRLYFYLFLFFVYLILFLKLFLFILK
jgi:hypothetical protein